MTPFIIAFILFSEGTKTVVTGCSIALLFEIPPKNNVRRMWLVVNVTGIHTAKPSEPRVPDVYPNQIVFCLSKLGISKK